MTHKFYDNRKLVVPLDISKFRDMRSKGGGHGIRDIYFKCCKKILNFSVQYILQHVDKISANSEMVEQEAFVELSWNDSYVNHLERHIPLYPAQYMQTYIHIYKEKSSAAECSASLKRRITLSHAHCSVC